MTILAKTITADELLGLMIPVDATILDIGCNDGSHSNWFLSLFPLATIHCFEPEPRAIQRFKQNLGTNPKVILHEFAISAKDGKATFHQSSGARDSRGARAFPDGWDLSGSLKRPNLHLIEHPWVKFEKVIDVETRSLDSWNGEAKLAKIDLLWMDVQGAEEDVFRGASETLRKTKYIYTEYSNKELYDGQLNLHQILNLLPEFELQKQYACDALLRNRLL